MVILIDNGHGSDTKGKCSPDGKLREFRYTREIAEGVVRQLRARGHDARRIVEEEADVSLAERVRRVNKVCDQYGARDVLLVSIHLNAAGADGRWHTARGWAAYLSANASQRSKQLASCLLRAASDAGLKVRRPQPSQDYWVQSLAMCRDTKCPAVLTENLFMDTREEAEFLLSDEGRKRIVALHVKGIEGYCGG